MSLLNHFQTGHCLCLSNTHKWCLASSDLCVCGRSKPWIMWSMFVHSRSSEAKLVIIQSAGWSLPRLQHSPTEMNWWWWQLWCEIAGNDWLCYRHLCVFMTQVSYADCCEIVCVCLWCRWAMLTAVKSYLLVKVPTFFLLSVTFCVTRLKFTRSLNWYNPELLVMWCAFSTQNLYAMRFNLLMLH